jgi:hypothetical protein
LPDKALLDLVRTEEVPPGCAAVRAQLLAALAAVEAQPGRDRDDPLGHPSIEGILLMTREGVATDVIVEHVRHLADVPVLDARAIAKLTKRGVPDAVLLALVQEQVARSSRAAAVAPAPAAAPAPAPAAKAEAQEARPSRKTKPVEPVAGSTGLGRIRVVAKSSLPVTYLEVLLDGNAVARKGEIPRGETKSGWMLPPPPELHVKGNTIVHESKVPVGGTRSARCSRSRGSCDRWDPWSGQRTTYETRTAGPADESGEVPACEIAEGRTCTVRARFQKRGNVYAVSYDSEVR